MNMLSNRKQRFRLISILLGVVTMLLVTVGLQPIATLATQIDMLSAPTVTSQAVNTFYTAGWQSAVSDVTTTHQEPNFYQ